MRQRSTLPHGRVSESIRDGERREETKHMAQVTAKPSPRPSPTGRGRKRYNTLLFQIRLQIKSLPVIQKWLPQIAEFLKSLAHIVDAKVFNPDSLLYLFPGDRSRNSRLRCRPDRINRSQGSSPGVLIVINQHATFGPLRAFVNGGDH